MGHFVRGVAVVFAALAMTGCDCLVPTAPGDTNGPNPTGPSGTTLVSLLVTGQNQIKVNATTPLTATASYSDGTTANVTTQSTWATNAAGICSVNAAGVTTGVGEGTCQISATLTAVSGRLDIQVTVDPVNPIPPPPPSPGVTLSHLQVSGPGSITVGQAVSWQATAFFSDNSQTNVTSTATWSSVAPGIASAAAGGMVTGVSAGNTTIQASYQGQSASGTILVSGGSGPPTVTSLSVSGNTSIQVGQTSQLLAVAQMSNGTSQTVTNTATWTSGAGAIASVSSIGLVTGNSAGQAQITATFQGQSASVTMQVSAGPGTPTTVGLVIQGAPCGVVGLSSQLQAIAQMSNGTTQNRTATATWATGNGGIATVSAGLVQCVGVGTTNITATVPGPFSATVPVTVVAAPPTRQLIGIRVDIEGQILTGNGLVGLGLASLLQDPLLTINVFALYSDGSQENVTALAALTTSNPLLVVNGPGVVNAAGVLVQALVNPSHYINVTYQGFTVIANVVISVPVLGQLPITGLQLNGPLTGLSVGTKLPDLMAVLSGPGVAGTVNLLIPSETAGIQWNIRPKPLTNCGLLALVCGTVNTSLQGLGNLANGVVNIAGGTVQSLTLGPLNAILAPVVSLLGGVMQVDINPIVNGIAGPVTTVPLPL